MGELDSWTDLEGFPLLFLRRSWKQACVPGLIGEDCEDESSWAGLSLVLGLHTLVLGSFSLSNFFKKFKIVDVFVVNIADRLICNFGCFFTSFSYLVRGTLSSRASEPADILLCIKVWHLNAISR